MGIIARTEFEKKVVWMGYKDLVSQLETAVGYELGLPEDLDKLSVIELELLVMEIHSIDMIFSRWPASDVHFIKQVLISLIREKTRNKKAKEPDEYYPLPGTLPGEYYPLFDDGFAEAVESLGKTLHAYADRYSEGPLPYGSGLTGILPGPRFSFE